MEIDFYASYGFHGASGSSSTRHNAGNRAMSLVDTGVKVECKGQTFNVPRGKFFVVAKINGTVHGQEEPSENAAKRFAKAHTGTVFNDRGEQIYPAK